MTTIDHDSADETPDDHVLLARLRDGDTAAYDILWGKHIGAALRLGHQLMPGRGDDLASEAFLAVYRQVTTTDSGPTSAFRAYLFTVMRNTAKKWGREQQGIDVFAEIEQIDDVDALQIVERQADASDLLTAFRALPERWQRVLWLAEVEGARRPAIAADLGIRPNAVSSLQRRARAGLREQWLTRLVPARLRDIPPHVGAHIPAYVIGGAATNIVRIVDAHLVTCDACAAVAAEVRASSTRLQRTTLSAVGFAALGTVASVSSPVVPAVAAGGLALLLGSAGLSLGTVGAIAIGSVAVVTAGSLAVGVLSGGTPNAVAEPATLSAAVPTAQPLPNQDAPADRIDRERGTDERTPVGGDTADGDTAGDRGTPAVVEPRTTDVPDPEPETSEVAPQTGRHNDDPTVPNIDASGGSSAGDGWAYPKPPDSAPAGSVPDPKPDPAPDSPATGGDDGSPDEEAPPVSDTPPGAETPPASETSLSPGMSTPTAGTVYLAPVVAGKTQPDAQVAVEYDGDRYLPEIAPDGSWTFDFRRLNTYGAGTYTYRVWAYTADDQSTATSGTFEIIPISVEGFTDPREPIPLEEASTTGVTISIQGPADGRVCIGEMSGATAEVPLDGDGRTVGRITVQEAYWYAFTLFACAPDSSGSDSPSTYFGAPVEGYLNAEDPTVLMPSPWGPGPDAVSFDFSEQ